MTTNQGQREQWNSDVQVRNWPKRERITTEVTPVLLEALALQPSERVLDIGCGGGLAAMDIARAVGPSGAVTGFDLSNGLIALATKRAAKATISNVSFVAGDAQVDAIPGAPYDAATSQFGVMFFADPVEAFENIRKHLRPGGRLVFACWQAWAKNTWFPIPVMAKYAPPPPSGTPTNGAPPPGPFAFADEKYVADILTRAGFAGTQVEAFEREVLVPDGTVFDRETLAPLRLEPEREEQAWKDLQAFGETLRGPAGQMRLGLGPQIVSARNPS